MTRKASKVIDLDKIYTSSQVLKKLDISPATLKSLVEKGVIEKVIPPGRERGYYTRTSVDEYGQQQRLFIETYTSKKERALEVRKATESDQEKIFEMEKEVLGECESFAHFEAPKKIGLLEHDFSIERGELTPTLKVKRRVIAENFAAVIGELYAGHAAPPAA